VWPSFVVERFRALTVERLAAHRITPPYVTAGRFALGRP
jgi:hypothetical protein